MNKGEIKFFGIGIFLIVLLTFFYFILNSQQPVKAEQIYETINYETNEKIVTNGIITMISPNEIVCKWSDPNSLWKDCEVVIEVNNSDTKNDLLLKGDTLLAKFLKDVQNFTVYTTYDYTLYNDTILNRTCFDNLNVTPEEKDEILRNKSICFYNYTRKNFYNFQPTTKLDKIYKNSVIGIKLVFKSPIVVDAGVYLKNHFNFTLLSDYNLILDPDISACSVLDTDYGVYTLTADIINSDAGTCMDITANHVTLDCQGHTIDGVDASSTYGIYVERSSATTTNITIKNCTLQDWYYNVVLYYADNNTLSNIISNSSYICGMWITGSNNIIKNSSLIVDVMGSKGIHLYFLGNNQIIGSNISCINRVSTYGIRIYYSDNNTIMNTSISYCNFGISIEHSNNNQVVNLSPISETTHGIYIDTSNNNIVYNNIIQNAYNGFYLKSDTNTTVYNNIIQNSSNYGIYISGSTSDKTYNNLFNNTNNFYFDRTVYQNYWNTTRQPGTRIYSAGTEIGGNYWTNPTGNGYSDTCTDADNDGFCDDPYTLATDNIDYLPLSKNYTSPNQPPFYSNIQISYPTAYNSVIPTEINITWVDNIGNPLDKVLLESNFTGSWVNITITNSTYGGDIYTFRQVFGAGTYCWRSHANDTMPMWNSTPLDCFTINKATPSLSLSSSPSWTVTYPTTVTITGNESNYGDNDLTYNLYRNGVLVSNPETIELGAGTYTYVFNTSCGQNYTSNSISNTLTINKGTPTLNLFINDISNNFTITWLQPVTIKGNESNYGDDDLVYCLYNSTSQIGCGSPFSITYNPKTFSNASSPYKFVYNTSEGANWTSGSSQTYYLFVNKAWNQTDNIKADEEYEYDLNKKGIPVLTKLINITPYNSSVEVGKPLFVYYNFSINNTNNDTGLTTTFTNVFANFTKYINTSIWQNLSVMENTFSSLAYNSPQYFIINASNITAYETSYSCSATYYQSWKKYDCNFGVYVIENNVTKTLPVIYYIDYPKLPEWSSRDKSATNWYVDSTTKGVSYEEDDLTNKIKFIVDTTHSSSSLDEGLHNFEVIYYIPIITGGGGGGGAIPQPKANVSFDVTPLLISKFVEAGENKPIISTVEGYTFLIKNTGPDPIFIEVKIEGDYKDWVSLTSISKMQVYQQPQYIAIDPGQTIGVKLYTNIPLTAGAGTYPVTIIFQDRDSKVYKTATINLVVSPAGVIYNVIAGLGSTIQKVMFYSVNFSPENNFNITKEGIYAKGLSEVSIPIGWLLTLLAFIIPSLLTSYLIKLRGGRKLKESYKKLIVYTVGFMGVVIFVLFLVGWLG